VQTSISGRIQLNYEQVAVSADIYSIQRSPMYWEEPDMFKPERWFDPANKDKRKANRPFLIGPRACIGRDMALQTLRLTLAKLAFRYDFEKVDQDFDWERDTSSSVIWTDFRVRLRIRVSQG
jgi:cytochrome P450